MMNPKDFYDKTAEKYDERHSNATARHMRKLEEKLIKKHAKGLVLDIGCGTGEQLKLLNSKAVGMDISHKMLQEARKKTDSFLPAAMLKIFRFQAGASILLSACSLF